MMLKNCKLYLSGPLQTRTSLAQGNLQCELGLWKRKVSNSALTVLLVDQHTLIPNLQL